MRDLDTEFRRICTTPSDINEHCELLRNLAATHHRVTEFGVRYGVSTLAFLAGRPKSLVSYDIVKLIDPDEFQAIAQETRFEFIHASSLEAEIANTDLLFIDTWHTAVQLRKELIKHHTHVSSLIALHDTTTFGRTGQDGGLGLLYALQEFMASHGDRWKIAADYEYNNGLTILARKELDLSHLDLHPPRPIH